MPSGDHEGEDSTPLVRVRRRAPPPGTVRWRGGDRKEGQQLDRPRGRELSRQLDRGHARERAAPVLRRQSRWNETSQLDNQEINDSNAELGPRTCRKQGASEIAAAEKGCATKPTRSEGRVRTAAKGC